MGRESVEIEALLGWAYRVEHAHRAPTGGQIEIASSVSRTNAQAVANYAALGTLIDCSGSAGRHLRMSSLEGRSLNPAAEAVHDAVVRLGATEVGLVIGHALADTRPDWMEGVEPAMVPWLTSRGRPEVYRNDKGQPYLCPVYCKNDPGMIAFARGVYLLWWESLASLVEDLGRLAGCLVTGPAAAREPWSTKGVDCS